MARHAVGAEPNNAAVLRILADVLMISGRSREAVAKIEAALRLDSQPTAHDIFTTGEVYFMDGQYARALDYYRLALKREPDNWQAHNGIMACCGELGLLAEAKASVTARLQLWPSSIFRPQPCTAIIGKQRPLIIGFRPTARAARRNSPMASKGMERTG